MLTEFFLVSGYAFWIVLGVVFLLDLALLSFADPDEQGWAVFFTVAAFLGVLLFTDAFAGVKVQAVVLGAILYLALGVIWSFKKWYDYVIEKKRDRYKDEKAPSAANHKTRITTWMTLWPFSFAWWVLTWPRRAFVWLYDRLSTIFDRISERIWNAA